MPNIYPIIRDNKERIEIGQRIREARLALGMSSVDVCNAMGIYDSAVSEWERCGHMAKWHVENLCDVLGVTPTQLFGKPPREVTDEEYEKLEALEAQKQQLRKTEKKIGQKVKLTRLEIKALEYGQESLSEDEATKLRRWELAQAWLNNDQEQSDSGEKKL